LYPRCLGSVVIASGDVSRVRILEDPGSSQFISSPRLKLTLMSIGTITIPDASGPGLGSLAGSLDPNNGLQPRQPPYFVAFVDTTIAESRRNIFRYITKDLQYPADSRDYFPSVDEAYEALQSFDNRVICIVSNPDAEPTALSRVLYEDTIFIAGPRELDPLTFMVAGDSILR